MKRDINFIGWQGKNNLGDEAILFTDKLLFPELNLIPNNRAPYSNVSLFGGGTLLPQWCSLCPKNKYNYAFGIGVQSPNFIHIKESFINRTKDFQFRDLTVRGFRSQSILRSWGIESEVIGDPVLSLKPISYSYKQNPNHILVNVGFSNGKVLGFDEPRLYRQIKIFCKYLLQENYQVTIIPFWEKDVQLCQQLGKELSIQVFKEWEDIEKSLNFISTGDVLVGVKLHSLVFAAAAGIPFLSIEYNPKCYDFAESVGLGEFNVSTDNLRSEEIINIFEKLIYKRQQVREDMNRYVEIYRKKQKITAERIIQDIEKLEYKHLNSAERTITYVCDFIENKISESKSKNKTFNETQTVHNIH